LRCCRRRRVSSLLDDLLDQSLQNEKHPRSPGHQPFGRDRIRNSNPKATAARVRATVQRYWDPPVGTVRGKQYVFSSSHISCLGSPTTYPHGTRAEDHFSADFPAASVVTILVDSSIFS